MCLGVLVQFSTPSLCFPVLFLSFASENFVLSKLDFEVFAPARHCRLLRQLPPFTKFTHVFPFPSFSCVSLEQIDEIRLFLLAFEKSLFSASSSLR